MDVNPIASFRLRKVIPYSPPFFTARLLTVADVARIAAIPPRVLLRDIQLEEVGALRIGARELRFLPHEAKRYLRAGGYQRAQLREFDRLTVVLPVHWLVPLSTMAAVLAVSPQHVRNVVETGAVDSVREGRQRFLSQEQAWAFLMRLERVGRIDAMPIRVTSSALMACSGPEL